MIRIAVVDDHPVVRDGVAANLAAHDDIEIAGTGASARDAIALAASSVADVMILDLELPDRSGLDLIAELKSLAASLRIIIFSAYAGEERVLRAFENGADSYVLKGTPSDDLVDTVRGVARGEARIPPDIAAQLARATRVPRGGRLTEREREILRHVSDGLSNRTIAERLGIAERTVKFHLSGILARLGAGSRSEAVAIARRSGLL